MSGHGLTISVRQFFADLRERSVSNISKSMSLLLSLLLALSLDISGKNFFILGEESDSWSRLVDGGGLSSVVGGALQLCICTCNRSKRCCVVLGTIRKNM
jgi:hypothetical protein